MIELSATEAALMGSGFTVVGALIGALATVFSARLAAEKQHIYTESAKFRSEFLNEIDRLRMANEDAFNILTDEVILRHRRAKTMFEPWVSGRKLVAFNQAWNSYERGIKTKAPGSVDNRARECKAALAQIEELLSYAQHRG